MKNSIGAEDPIECVAEGGQPLGNFVWKIGEDEEDENAILLEATEEAQVEEEDDGSFTSTQVGIEMCLKIVDKLKL